MDVSCLAMKVVNITYTLLQTVTSANLEIVSGRHKLKFALKCGFEVKARRLGSGKHFSS